MDENRYVNFSKEFLKNYSILGFGNMPKKDTEILVFYLFLKYIFGDSEISDPEEFYDYVSSINPHDLSTQLKIPEARINKLIYELELRYIEYNEDMFINKLQSLVDTNKYEVVSNVVRFRIQDPLFRQYFEGKLREYNVFFDGSFSKNVMSMSTQGFATLLFRMSNLNIDNANMEKIVKLLYNDIPYDELKDLSNLITNQQEKTEFLKRISEEKTIENSKFLITVVFKYLPAAGDTIAELFARVDEKYDVIRVIVSILKKVRIRQKEKKGKR